MGVKPVISGGGGGSGESNSGQNIGSSGISVFKDKVTTFLRFKKLNPKSAKVTITDDVANDKIDFDVDEDSFDATKIKNRFDAAVPLVDQAEAEAGIGTTKRQWSALRVAQAIAALAPAGGGGGAKQFFTSTFANPTPGGFFAPSGESWQKGTRQQAENLILKTGTLENFVYNSYAGSPTVEVYLDGVLVATLNVTATVNVDTTTSIAVTQGQLLAYKHTVGSCSSVAISCEVT